MSFKNTFKSFRMLLYVYHKTVNSMKLCKRVYVVFVYVMRCVLHLFSSFQSGNSQHVVGKKLGEIGLE